jgi:hypothetical protein
MAPTGHDLELLLQPHPCDQPGHLVHAKREIVIFLYLRQCDLPNGVEELLEINEGNASVKPRVSLSHPEACRLANRRRYHDVFECVAVFIDSGQERYLSDTLRRKLSAANRHTCGAEELRCYLSPGPTCFRVVLFRSVLFRVFLSFPQIVQVHSSLTASEKS